MAFEDSKKAKVIEQDFHSPSSCGCGRTAQVAIATCVNTSTGAEKTGAASEFCGRDNHNNPNWVLQDWWRIQSYIGYCSDCLAGIKPAGLRKYSDDQVRVAWQWLMGEVSHDSDSDQLGMTFKRVSLTDDQRDRAIEIVNHEANRTNQPDSIPDKYKMSEVWR